jgi:D-alanine-D-alanine ligase-like ATP-grasp enzyme
MAGGSLETRLIEGALRAGGPVRAWSARLDLVRSTGLRYGLYRRRERHEEAEFGRHVVDAFYREAWEDAAGRVGAQVIDLGSGFLEIRADGVSTRVWRQLTAVDEAVSLRLALDKARVHRLLVERGVTVPEHREIDCRDGAAGMDFIAAVGGDCFLKPAAGTSGGAGVTGRVRDERSLARARLSAGRFDDNLLIERQLPGDMYRLLFLDGRLVDTVRRRIPTVAGDGRSTVLELILAENRRRLKAERPRALMTIDLDSVLSLEAGGFTTSSVPADGQIVAVKSTSSDNGERDNHTIGDVSPVVVEESARAVAAVGLRLAGIDLVTPDISRPLREAGGAIIEVNGTPGFQYHYEVEDRAGATPVALPVLETLLEEARRPAAAG